MHFLALDESHRLFGRMMETDSMATSLLVGDEDFPEQESGSTSSSASSFEDDTEKQPTFGAALYSDQVDPVGLSRIFSSEFFGSH